MVLQNASTSRARWRTASLGMLVIAMGTSACWPFRRVPKSTTNSVSPSEKNEAQRPLFTSRDGAPTSFVATTSDAKSTRVVMVRDGLTKPALFKVASDYLAEHYTIDVTDPNAGYLMTPWQASLSRDGVPELRYRTRIIVRFLGDQWKQLAVRAEANWLHGDEWQVGYDAALLDSVSANLARQLGKRE